MKNVVIVSGGTIRNPEFIREKCAQIGEPFVICADGAARHLRPLGLIPSVIIGDMDSIDERDREYFKKRGSTILAYPQAKDETDTELALMYGLNLGPQEIWILGALGGRIDHTLANVSLLVAAAKRGIPTKIVDEDCEIFVVTGQVTLEGTKGQTVSLLPVSSVVTGITLDGFEYPLRNHVIEIGSPLGVSNTLAGDRGVISVGTGYLLVIRYYRKEA
ncbi:MAG: thiamine diphosphokinase [Deltaproteobacteria bacterium]|nr:thiamine diphosphokinase [Deltaproteobacteria bacterium]MBN2688749.1 thiamine diphosphokinase [Deltaproteobacteria bacterium]